MFKNKLIRIMNKKYIVTLTESEIEFLKELISTRSSKSSVVLNAQILLAANANEKELTDDVIAQRYHVKPLRVQRTRQKFVLHGLSIALNGLKRGPQKSRLKIDGDVEAHIVQIACSEVPDGYNKWTLRLLADKAVELKIIDEISHESVRQVLKKTKQSLGNMKCG